MGPTKSSFFGARDIFIFNPSKAEEEKSGLFQYYLNNVPGRQSCDYEHPELPRWPSSKPKTLQIYFWFIFVCAVFDNVAIIWHWTYDDNFWQKSTHLYKYSKLLVSDLAPCRASDQWQARVHAGMPCGGWMLGNCACLKYPNMYS